MSVETAVQKLANIFEEAEQHARDTKEDFRAMRKMLEEIRDAGVIGGLECQQLAGEADALATQFEASVWDMHRRWTVRAQELGVDLPQPRSGGR